MSGHSTEQVMELSLMLKVMILFCHLIQMIMNYDYQGVLHIPPRVQGNLTDSSSDSGSSRKATVMMILHARTTYCPKLP